MKLISSFKSNEFTCTQYDICLYQSTRSVNLCQNKKIVYFVQILIASIDFIILHLIYHAAVLVSSFIIYSFIWFAYFSIYESMRASLLIND